MASAPYLVSIIHMVCLPDSGMNSRPSDYPAPRQCSACIRAVQLKHQEVNYFPFPNPIPKPSIWQAENKLLTIVCLFEIVAAVELTNNHQNNKQRKDG